MPSLRVAAKVQEELYGDIRRAGTPQARIARMQTRAELYDTFRYFDDEAPDRAIVTTVLP
ncbi:hypothetical protein MKI84_12210 [Ancylobacter sp. A5.8]|uniref:hypothetical protein n=1 Tax=Ancylobacter gelatini TaxID=2919920 RepID=UPI001F4D5428|nr:hypothetical protein [Ancylobacter gelatini]MCJ8143679.1 hypothetical protein [Ancylobacter gelatini]